MPVIPTRAWTGRSWFGIGIWLLVAIVTVLVLLAWLWPTIPLSRELRAWVMRAIPYFSSRL